MGSVEFNEVCNDLVYYLIWGLYMEREGGRGLYNYFLFILCNV